MIAPQVHASASPDRPRLRHRSTPSVEEAFSSLFLSLSLWPTKAKKLSNPPTISNLQTNLVAVASFRPIHQSRHYQTHLMISPLSDPPINLFSFRPIHWSVVLYLSLSLNLSLPLPLSRSVLIFEKDWFFYFLFLFFIVDLVYRFRFPIIIFVWKLRKCEKMFSLKDFQKHNQTLEIIFISGKYFHLKIFYTLKSFYIEPNVA